MLNFAIIGCGRIGTKKHIQACIENADIINLVAVCDIKKEKAEQASQIYSAAVTKKPSVYTDYIKMLESENIQAVAVATESGLHYQVATDCMYMDKNVLVEKPMALSTDHMDKMIKLAKDRGLKLGVCFQNRFNAPIQELRKKVESGGFGRIFHAQASVRWNRNRDYYKQASWRGTWEMDGGTLMNQCTHNTDLLIWMLGGEVEEVNGVIRNFNHDYISTEDFGGAVIKFKNGSVGILEGTSNVYEKNLDEKLSIFGENGTVVIGGLAVNKIETWRFENENSHPFQNLPDPDTVYGNGHVPLYRDFCEAVTTGREPFINGEEGKKAVQTILAIYKSSLTGSPVKFPFDFSTLEMKGYFNK